MSYQDSLSTIQTIVGDPATFRGGKPQWKSVDEMDRFLTGKGFRLSAAEPMGPKGKTDGQQLIYEGPNNVIVKVKTRGYNDNGPPQRVGVATMSIEATDGKGTGWDNVLFKVDSNGKVLAKSITANNEEVVRLPADHKARVPAREAKQPEPEWGVRNPRDGSVRPFSKFEVIEGGANPTPVNKQAWADASHMNLPEDFDPTGADKLAAKVGSGPKPPTGGGGGGGAGGGGGSGGTPLPKPTPPTRLQGIYRGVGAAAATALKGIALAWFKSKFIDAPAFNSLINDRVIPDIVARLNKMKYEIAALQANGKTAYANVVLEIGVIRPMKRHVEFYEVSPPLPELKSIKVSAQDINGVGQTRFDNSRLITMITVTPYTFSFVVALPQADIDRFKELTDAIDDLNLAILDPRTPFGMLGAMKQELRILKDQLDKLMDAN